jgi:hypothetical protein
MAPARGMRHSFALSVGEMDQIILSFSLHIDTIKSPSLFLMAVKKQQLKIELEKLIHKFIC